MGYDPTKRTLEIEFTSGEVYDYLQVPPFVYQSFTLAPSKGQFFSYYVREHYPTRKMT
jgi:hypothetical protein